MKVLWTMTENRGPVGWFSRWNEVGKFWLLVLCLLFICEVLIYYIVLLQCSWPTLDPLSAESGILPGQSHTPLRVMLLADTHLLGSRNGHWFDKLRREWQMHRAFQTALTIFSPDVIFILGDVFDEGLWCSDKEFSYYVNRYNSLFYAPEKTNRYVVVGNHDIGFHYSVSKHHKERFERAFNVSSVQFVVIQGNIFIMLNSMAMVGDGCSLCQEAEDQLREVAHFLRCTKGEAHFGCHRYGSLPSYSRPVFLQHFPMYRESDAICSEPDSAPPLEKNLKFREHWECLSKQASDRIIKLLNPRVMFSGHTHHGCFSQHWEGIPEWTLPSFSWRNKKNPSFMLGIFTPNNYSLRKCYMPVENTVFMLYFVGGSLIILWFIMKGRKRWFCLVPGRTLKEKR
ncbi:metallophosphoesterase 1-like [Tachypleus tridentatus]|uniref:metallophosphoesterase 1-like n=1 Tax=Tachypleus tridentatus TaxID=6853 RepID=UPI003FCF8B26